METRANYVWVGAVTLVLLAALAAFIVWIAGFGTSNDKQYDIFFPQAVEGLSEGSTVSFSGVPVGKVTDMRVWKDPQFVQVRISVKKDTPVLQGTTATVLGSFTGISTIQLDGGKPGSPPITAIGRDGVPEIQPKAGGIGAILSSAPQLLDSLTSLTDRLTELLSPQNQHSIGNILHNTDLMTRNMADASPRLNDTLAQLQATLAQAQATLAQAQQTLGSADQMLNKEGPSVADNIRETMASVRKAADEAQAALADARPAARELSQSTLPQADAALRDLKRTTEALRQMTETIQNHGAGSLLKGKNLPDYKP
jgi:phospholipid/cholesterol/gamma-HCH transport system substrate-binding protein